MPCCAATEMMYELQSHFLDRRFELSAGRQSTPGTVRDEYLCGPIEMRSIVPGDAKATGLCELYRRTDRFSSHIQIRSRHWQLGQQVLTRLDWKIALQDKRLNDQFTVKNTERQRGVIVCYGKANESTNWNTQVWWNWNWVTINLSMQSSPPV